MPARVTLHVNGEDRKVDAAPDTPLLYVLRNDLALSGPRFGCGLGQCGACSVLVDGKARRSCTLPISGLAGAKIRTLESLGTADTPGALQRAFIAEQAAQCGYCSNGMIIAAQELLSHHPDPTPAQVKAALNGNLCRCGTHNRIVRAVMRAAKEMRA